MDELLHILCDIASSTRNQIPCELVKAQHLSGTAHFIRFIRFADGIEWIARIPYKSPSVPCAVPNEDIERFASEISTMRWLKQNTQVKVPELYAWNIPTAQNPGVGNDEPDSGVVAAERVPWMLMEKLPGVPLTYEMWDNFKDDQREKVRELLQK